MSNQYPVEIDGITGEVEDLPPRKVIPAIA